MITDWNLTRYNFLTWQRLLGQSPCDAPLCDDNNNNNNNSNGNNNDDDDDHDSNDDDGGTQPSGKKWGLCQTKMKKSIDMKLEQKFFLLWWNLAQNFFALVSFFVHFNFFWPEQDFPSIQIFWLGHLQETAKSHSSSSRGIAVSRITSFYLKQFFFSAWPVSVSVIGPRRSRRFRNAEKVRSRISAFNC